MAATLVDECVVPARAWATTSASKGDVVRVIPVEGPQAADLIAFNAHDYRESLSTWLTRMVSKSFTSAQKVYTKLPAGNVMFDVESTADHVLWLSPGRCNRLKYEELGHPNCQEILEECVQSLGLTRWDVPDVFNIFMRVEVRDDFSWEFLPSPVTPDDYVDLRAHMDVIIGVSACPDDVGAYNLGGPKPLKIEVWREEGSDASGSDA